MLVRSAIGAALLVAGVVQATALTALINANERNCYYADVDGAGEKVGEYELELGRCDRAITAGMISVRPVLTRPSFHVRSAINFQLEVVERKS